MKNLFLLIAICFFIACSQPHEKQSPDSEYPTTGSVEKLSDGLDALIAPGTQIEVLAEGFDWAEGPVWVADGNYVLFTDIPPNNIWKWSEENGKELYLNPAGYTGEAERGGEVGANGLWINQEGELVLCQHGDRRLAKLKDVANPDAKNFETLADNFEGKRFNSPNDVVQHSNSSYYFTDPPYGLEKRMEDPLKELDFQGVYHLSNDGEVRLITDQQSRPNGIVLSPDEKTLYVANSDHGKADWTAYTIGEDGLATESQQFYDATEYVGKEGFKGLPDGMVVHPSGNIFATGPGGVWVFTAEGTLLGRILTGEATANCTIGNDGEYLYMTADMYLMRIKLAS